MTSSDDRSASPHDSPRAYESSAGQAGGPPEYLTMLLSRLAEGESASKLRRPSCRNMKSTITLICACGFVVMLPIFGWMLVRTQTVATAFEMLAPTDAERSELLNVNYVRLQDLSTSSQATQKIKLHIKGVRFPCTLTWKVGNENFVFDVPTGDITVQVPIGKPAVFFCKPKFTQAWLQPIQTWIRHEDAEPQLCGYSVSKCSIALEPTDELTIFIEQPIAPWNAIVIPYKDTEVLLTLERPTVNKDLETWQSGRWQESAPEELPNTALFWARDGSQGLAGNLAEFFVDHRDEPQWVGRFRNLQHVSLIVYYTADGIPGSIKDISQTELTKVLEAGFEKLKTHRRPFGRTVQEEIAEATELLNRTK